MHTRKKLIEVALPLEAINVASAREKSIRHGHPSTLHLWWARRPLASARAVIFAQMVDDPSAVPEEFPTEQAQNAERQRLFKIIEDLVLWENTTNEVVLNAARAELWRSWRRACADNTDHPEAATLFDAQHLPAFHDPFAGGGALPLEAQRLGLESHASDLNPVAVLINKAMIEIPPKFADRPPVNPDWQRTPPEEKVLRQWRGAQGLAEDVRYYGNWMRVEAQKRIGHLYPKVAVTSEMVAERPDLRQYQGSELTVIAWIWARTVKSPNPAYARVDVPLASTFILSTKTGKEAYVEPIIEGDTYRFVVKTGKSADEKAGNGTKLAGSGSAFYCLLSKTPITFAYIREEAKKHGLGSQLMAIVAEGAKGRVYLSSNTVHISTANTPPPEGIPLTSLPDKALGFRVQEYGMLKWSDLFTNRQLVALTTFSDLVSEAVERIERDQTHSGEPADTTPLTDGGSGALAYAQAVGVYLAFAVSKIIDRSSSLCRWDPTPTQSGIINTFSRQALPMSWDFAESQPLGTASGSFVGALELIHKVMNIFITTTLSFVQHANASTQTISRDKIVATDPPYYDNIGYADLSDFFYVWLRKSLQPIYPALFSTLSVPKAEELVATPYRHGSKLNAETFFLTGMTQAMRQLATLGHRAFPVTIYYAFKQSESDTEGATTNTGWDTFLEAVIQAGFAINGTWPQRTEMANRMIGSGTNALASSIVLVCRAREATALQTTRGDFVNLLKRELPDALRKLQQSNIAPVDLAQAAIGPGMAVYSRFSTVLDASGKRVTVRQALALINETLDEVLSEQEGDFDADSRCAIAWFDQYGFSEGEFGVGDGLARAKNTSIAGMVKAGIMASARGKVRLLKPDELAADWDPSADDRLTVWESVHQLIRAMQSGGESAAAVLVAKLGAQAEIARELAYRLYTTSERKKRPADALHYNALVQSFPAMTELAHNPRITASGEQQSTLFE